MDSLGINIVNLIINVILFGLFYAIIDKLVLKKLYGVLEKRKIALDLGITNTDKSKDLLDSTKKDLDEMRKKAKLESDHIIREAHRIAEIEGKKILNEVMAESAQIREKANAALVIQKQKLEMEFNARVEVAVKTSLEKIIRESKNLEI